MQTSVIKKSVFPPWGDVSQKNKKQQQQQQKKDHCEAVEKFTSASL